MAAETTTKAGIDTFLNIAPLELERVGLTKDSLKGEVAIVTGGASNVGLGYARSIAGGGREGCHRGPEPGGGRRDGARD